MKKKVQMRNKFNSKFIFLLHGKKQLIKALRSTYRLDCTAMLW